MSRLMIFANNVTYRAYPIVFDFRQGMKPKNISVTTPWPTVATNAKTTNYAVTPNKKHSVGTNGSGAPASSMLYSITAPDRDVMIPDMLNPIAKANAICSAVACSNEHFAFGFEGSPYLYVFDWESQALQSVSTVGITGDIYGLAFSPDGKYLCVHFRASPYIRIYKTSDWSYIVPSITGPYPYVVNACLMHVTNNKVVLFGSNASPYISVYDIETGDSLFRSTSSTVAGQAYGQTIMGFVVHPDDPDTLIFCSNQNPRGISSFNLETFVISSPFGDQPVSCYGISIDNINRKLIVIHSIYLGRYCSLVDIDGEGDFEYPGYDLDSSIRSSTLLSMTIIDDEMFKISGTVRDVDNSPASREVYSIDRETKEVTAVTNSDEVTGDYELILPFDGNQDVVFKADESEKLNDLIFAKVEPEAM